jgi:hypothetical protein
MNIDAIYNQLRSSLEEEVTRHNLENQEVQVRCKALTPREAIGNPDHDDYPISKGKEVMIEALFQKTRGQAFTDAFVNEDYRIKDLLQLDLNKQANRAGFIAALNAIFRHLNLCDKTIHCRDTEPVNCAQHLRNVIEGGTKVLLIGHQPRFLEVLASHCRLRVIDLDESNIGKTLSGVTIEPRQKTPDAVRWSDFVFATGSTIVNGTITDFLNQEKPVMFYGVTISAAAKILGLQSYCHCGH